MSTNTQKDVVYIDVEDDITAIIDKMQNSPGKIVALVLPKRAAVLQSIVNMKLLKRMADNAKKNAVLVSSDVALMPLAGAVGMYVAKTPQSKPFIPDPPMMTTLGADKDGDIELDQNMAVGALVAATAEPEDAIEIDNESNNASEQEKPSNTKQDKKKKNDKKQKVPNFERFRKRLFIGLGVVILLGVAWFVMAEVLPKAKIIITTDDTNVDVKLSLIASPTAQSVDIAKGIVPGKVQEYRKSDTQKVPATGQKDMGTKASGTVSMTTQTDCIVPVASIKAGSTVTASSLNYITQVDAVFVPADIEEGKCVWKSNKVEVIAQNAGDQYNLAARAYTVAGRSAVTAQGSDMSGGTTNVVKVVTQADIDGAKAKILESAGSTSAPILSQQLRDAGYIAIEDSLTAGEPLVTASPNVDTQADEVTVTVVVPYKMTGIQQDGTTQAVEAAIKSQIDESKQTILDNGMSKAVIRRVENSRQNGDLPVSLQTTAVAGVVQDEQKIKEGVAGKERGEIQETLMGFPGIKAVEVEYSPFWVMTTTDDVDKITVVFQQNGENTESE